MTDLPPQLSALSALADAHSCRTTPARVAKPRVGGTKCPEWGAQPGRAGAARPAVSEEAEWELVAWLTGVLEEEGEL